MPETPDEEQVRKSREYIELLAGSTITVNVRRKSRGLPPFPPPQPIPHFEPDEPDTPHIVGG